MITSNAELMRVVSEKGEFVAAFEGSWNVKAFAIIGPVHDEMTFYHLHALLYWCNAKDAEEAEKAIVRVMFQDKRSKESTKYVPIIRAIGHPIKDEFIILGKSGFYTQDEVFELLTRADVEGAPPEAKLDPRERIPWSREYLHEKPDIPLTNKPNPFGIKSANPTKINESPNILPNEEKSPKHAKAEDVNAESEVKAKKPFIPEVLNTR